MEWSEGPIRGEHVETRWIQNENGDVKGARLFKTQSRTEGYVVSNML